MTAPTAPTGAIAAGWRLASLVLPRQSEGLHWLVLSSLPGVISGGAALPDDRGCGRPAGPRLSTARQGRAQCRGSGWRPRELRREVGCAPPGGALIN